MTNAFLLRLVMLLVMAFAFARPIIALAGMPEWLEAERRGDWPALVREYEALARQGNAMAMCNLSRNATPQGATYRRGNSVQSNGTGSDSNGKDAIF